MEVYRKLSEIPIHDDSIITIGTFDGCHRGHQDIFKKSCLQRQNNFM
ncbi:MAG: hypothetical protein Ct9H90mP7_4330 [Candidatus Neomarinimicrobiota bacterium]|nr:MAG: hypothetical protein Ct9H90mP7_4330 [Candidatus Neomarinimicrobiota bacterium]